jgi:hypothetical protein
MLVAPAACRLLACCLLPPVLSCHGEPLSRNRLKCRSSRPPHPAMSKLYCERTCLATFRIFSIALNFPPTSTRRSVTPPCRCRTGARDFGVTVRSATTSFFAWSLWVSCLAVVPSRRRSRCSSSQRTGTSGWSSTLAESTPVTGGRLTHNLEPSKLWPRLMCRCCRKPSMVKEESARSTSVLRTLIFRTASTRCASRGLHRGFESAKTSRPANSVLPTLGRREERGHRGWSRRVLVSGLGGHGHGLIVGAALLQRGLR